ncbi:Hypothetical protein, putative [Bodo saltans]|uniref:Uncharacterized protein n=1 Tax=Bodo saltans TaxID=75058 RepID=A0A0S4J1F2_BODSA|nr:Hypothetical protein, putative [Bodo saltans]|eukprot:CUG81301.1 Hypothetical protein, putative [Bodo saltans]
MLLRRLALCPCLSFYCLRLHSHLGIRMRSAIARRSISPTAISDVSDASPTGSPRAASGRLVNTVPHVHYNVDATTPGRRSLPHPSSADQRPGPIFTEVRRLLSSSRSTPGGLGGRLTFSDLDRLLSHFRVDVFGADTVDDIWVSLCELCGFKVAPAFISDVSAITSVLEQFGGRAPEAKPQRSLPPRERSMSPTVSSARKNITQQQRYVRVTPASKQHHGTEVFSRLTRDAEVSRTRRDDIQRTRALERDEMSASECTFTPHLGKHNRSVPDGRSHGYDGPTQSSLSRVLTPRRLDPEDDAAGVEGVPYVRRSLPSHVPNQVPVGYVEAVSRLRHGASERLNGRQSFEESLRGPCVVSERKQDPLLSGTILRISVPSLGEVVHVRLASPRRR